MDHILDHEENAAHHAHHARTLRERLAEKRNMILLVGTLIATITFQAALTPPGGVWQDNSDKHKAGDSVMAHNHPRSYATFYLADLVGFIASVSTIFLLLTALRPRNHFISGILIGALIGVMCLTFISVVVIAAVSIAAMTPETVDKEIHHQAGVFIGVIFYCVLMISPMTALVAFCFLIPHGTVDVTDEEVPQIQQVDRDETAPHIQGSVRLANGDQEAYEIELVINHANGEQEASQVQVNVNHANRPQETCEIQPNISF